jgi:predicted acetyltransferase
MQLVWPGDEHLASYINALKRGWSPDTMRPAAAEEQLARIAADRALFLAQQVDREAKGPLVVLPDGKMVPRIPGYHRWMWDGEFSGVINFRWQPGTTALPPHCLGHIGYSVVPWKRGRGYATHALQLLLPEVEKEGLEFIEITTDVDNIPSRKVIEANGGILIEHFHKPDVYGGAEGLRFRILLSREPASTGIE